MRTVLITGANKGLGFETAKQLAMLGFFVIIGSRDKNRGHAAKEQLESSGLSNVESIEIDITDLASIRRAKAELEPQGRTIDILINNAGISGVQPQGFLNGDPDNLRTILETNFFGAVQVTRELLPLLMRSNTPSIINVSSELGSLSLHSAANRNPNYANYHAYGTSKTALNAFTILLARELQDAGVCVNSVTPGYTATDLNQFQGLKTVEEGAKAIVTLAASTDRSVTGKFFKDKGEVPW